MMDKQPYRIPTVPEIADVEGSNGLTAVSTFAGAGGSSTGYRWAGYRVAWASEFMAKAADSYEANWPRCIVDRRDVRTVPGTEILDRIGIDRGDLDLFDGSPPCQPFSSAGKREKNWHRAVAHGDGTVNKGGSEDLVSEWVRLVGEMQPRAAVMENVKGLTMGKAKGYLIGVLNEVRALGYNVEAKLLDAQWLGVPQRRVRVIVVAVRKDVGRPVYPDPFPYRYTIADACPWLGSDGVLIDMRRWGTERTDVATNEPSPTIVSTGAQQNRPLVHVTPVEGPTQAETILAGDQNNNWPVDPDGNPAAPRKFAILEVKRLCGFPDDYVLTGSYAEQWARLGNSVPPPMARAVGGRLAELLAG